MVRSMSATVPPCSQMVSVRLGAPNLTDDIWLHGGTVADIERTIGGGRQGAMPAWSSRLTEDQMRVLAAYVYHLAHPATAAAPDAQAAR